MSIISQIGVVILIAFIVLVLIRSNKNLKKASEEGENFVDEWALRQEKKEEIKQKREEKKLEVQKEKEQKKLQKKQKRKGILVDEDNEPEEYELREEKEEKQALEEEQYAEEYPKKNDFSEMEYEEESQQDGYDGESIRVNTDWLYDYEEQERKRQERMQPEESSAGQDYKDESGKIVPMKKRETTGITLMKLDANHRVMARYRVNKIPFTIGRSTSNDLVLDDLCVARNHCRIIERDGRYLLEDVGTMNKLYVNGMVTGQVPFDGETTVEVAMKHLQQEITPPSELVPDIPYSLEQIILKCTQKSVDRRYQKA